MTEERKHAILFAATLLCARKIIGLIDTDVTARMSKKHWLDSLEKQAIEHVAQLAEKIDERWPEERDFPSRPGKGA